MAAHSVQMQLTRENSSKAILFSLARVPDSLRIFCGGSDGGVHLTDLAADEPKWTTWSGHRSYVSGAVWSPSALITGGWDRQLIWWDLESGAPFRRVMAHGRWLRAVTASPDGTQIASVADDMVCRLWDARSGRLISELRGHAAETPHHFPSMLFTCTYSPDGKLLATADKVGQIVVWEVESGREVARLEAAEHYTWDPRQRRHSIGGTRSLAFSPDGKFLAAGGIGEIGNVDHLGGKALVFVYDWAKGQRTHKFEHPKHNGLVSSLRFDPQRNWLIGAGGANNGIILVMDLESSEFLYDTEAPMHIHAFEYCSESGQCLAAGHQRAALWKVLVSPAEPAEG